MNRSRGQRRGSLSATHTAGTTSPSTSARTQPDAAETRTHFANYSGAELDDTNCAPNAGSPKSKASAKKRSVLLGRDGEPSAAAVRGPS